MHRYKDAAARRYKDATGVPEVTDAGLVRGYASTFDRDPDSYGEVVAKGAFADTLAIWEGRKEKGVYIPLLYGHNVSDPKYNIGRVTNAVEDERGLLVEAEFDGESATAQYVRKLAREGRLFQFSFAFDVLDQGEVELEDGTKANELRRLDLFEVSLVQIPANQHAEVVEVKAGEIESGAISAIGRVHADVTPPAKYGRRNSKADEDTIAEVREHLSKAMTLLDGLTDSGEGDGDEDEKGAAGEPSDDAQTSGGKGATVADAGLIAMLKSIEEED